MAPRILVTDGEERSALAVVRSLGHVGHRVFLCSKTGKSLAGASRHVEADRSVPDPLEEPARYAEALGALVRDLAIDILLPVTEAAMLAVLESERSGWGAIVPFGDLEAFRRICSKEEVLLSARRLGMVVPEQQVAHSRSELEAILRAGVSWPVVVKPSRSIGLDGSGRRWKSGVAYAASNEALRGVVADLSDAAFPLLLQQRIVGPGVGIFLLRWDGRILATFSHRRIREKPPSGGVSVYSESIPADPELVARSRDLLEGFGWQGVAMVEFKVDETSGRAYLMEINPRFWGSLQLAIDAGVDFPALLVAAASGQEARAQEPYSVGTRSRWWWGDVDQLLTHLRHDAEHLSLPPEAPSKVANLWAFLHFWRRGDRSEILRWSDPLPFVRETIRWFSRE